MIVYRIEDKFGAGPCGSGFVYHKADDKHPHPSDDCDLWKELAGLDRSGLVFGCSTLSGLHTWFSKKDRETMRQKAELTGGMIVYHVVAYKIAKRFAEISRSKKQVVFFQRQARELWRSPI